MNSQENDDEMRAKKYFSRTIHSTLEAASSKDVKRQKTQRLHVKVHTNSSCFAFALDF
jgi:hypothetical protein